MAMHKVVVVAGILLGLAGCMPGEAEFTLKTSEVLKALRGEMAQVSVHEKMETVLSNASRKVTFGGGKFTNQLDVVKALAADVMKKELFDFGRGEWTNDILKVWVEEKTNALPCVKMEARLRVALGTGAAIEKYVSTGRVVEVCALQKVRFFAE